MEFREINQAANDLDRKPESEVAKKFIGWLQTQVSPQANPVCRWAALSLAAAQTYIGVAAKSTPADIEEYVRLGLQSHSMHSTHCSDGGLLVTVIISLPPMTSTADMDSTKWRLRSAAIAAGALLAAAYPGRSRMSVLRPGTVLPMSSPYPALILRSLFDADVGILAESPDSRSTDWISQIQSK
jgi:hypothetical protein